MTSATLFHPMLAPDPFAPLLIGDDARDGHMVRRQRRSRATILATARKLLADASQEFTLRRLADECGTTTQTLRNGFGRREDLLVAAFNDHTSAVWHALASFSSGPCIFLDLAQMYHRCAQTRAAFLRAMVTSAVANVRPLSITQRHGSQIKSFHLRGMASAHTLRPDVDAAMLAAHITRLNTFMMYEWAAGGEADDLRHAMIDGNRRLLLGAVTTEYAPLVEAWKPAAAH